MTNEVGIFLDLISDGTNVKGTVTNSAYYTVGLNRFVLPKGFGNGWQVCVEFLTGWNAIHNVTVAIGNTKLFYKIPGDAITVYEVEAAEGIYSFQELWEVFQLQIIAAGHFTVVDGKDVPFFEMLPNFNTQKILVKINAVGTQVIFNSDIPFYGILASQSPFLVTAYAANLADATNGLKTVMVNVPGLVDNAFVNGEGVSYMHGFTPNFPPGSSFEVTPLHRKWFRVSPRSVLSELTVQLVSQTGKQIVMAGGNANPFHLQLHFQPSWRQPTKQL
jgi:hypothetical protein